MKFENIIVGTDLSPASQPAVTHACQLAHQFQARLHIVHVAMVPFLDYIEQVQEDFGQTMEACEEQHVAQARQTLLELDTTPLSADQIVPVVLRGLPVDQIQAYARSHAADLLILGTHGYTRVKHALMGSTAERLVRESTCPVLTIRQPTESTTAA